MFYSKTTNWFYDESIHGSRKLSIADPAWVHPQIEVPDPEFDPTAHPDGTPVPMILVDDPDAIQATIEVDNPGCKIPADAVEITDAEHAALLAAQTAGKIIQGDVTGRPVAVEPPAPSLADAKAAAMKEIDAAAGVARGRYITIAPGQEATYLIKAQQAAAFKTGGYTGTVPGLVQAEVDATGGTAQQATDDILAQEATWAFKAGQIESARRRGKVAVGNAADLSAVAVVRDAASAELAAL